ncbi:hypothetical protein ACTHGU_08815 [Chitinophagaceae bacterium MMS25-I14]
MAYNVLNYGQYPLCQGPDTTYHGYLKKIISYTSPDILGLEKMGSIKLDASDFHGTAPLGFGDSILKYALNAAYPGRYAYCTYTNASQADNMSVLFYNKQKLGFLGIVCSYGNVTDFNTYKLYYKDTNLAVTHDTTFLYVVLNHDQSGSSATTRNIQIAGEMQQLQNRFTHLPNVINMGDFNTRNTSEGCYQTLVNPADTGYRFYDPPFYPDNNFSYPADWDSSPNNYTGFLTTSTRQSASIPNSCGTSGGAKSWYDHIFLSSWILNNTNYISYLPHSYRTIGNDGHRLSVSINDNAATVNTSAPTDVIDALFQMSNKYPVAVKLLVRSNITGTSPVDPQVPTAIVSVPQLHDISVINPVGEKLVIGFPAELMGQKVKLQCADVTGRVVLSNEIVVGNPAEQMACSLSEGVYFFKISTANGMAVYKTILKQ